jgi:hypothetical protein
MKIYGLYHTHSFNMHLTNYGKKNSRNNIYDVGSLAKCGCIMCTTIVYWWITDTLVYLVCQKLANCA